MGLNVVYPWVRCGVAPGRSAIQRPPTIFSRWVVLPWCAMKTSFSAISAVVSLPSQAWGRLMGLLAIRRVAVSMSKPVLPYVLKASWKAMSRFQVLKARSAGAFSGFPAYSPRTSRSRLLLLAQMKSLWLPGVSAGLPFDPVRHRRVFSVPSRKQAPSSVLVSAMVQSLV